MIEATKALVPVNGDEADEAAIKLACSSVKKKKGTVYIIYVIEMKRTLPLDAEIGPEIERGEEVLEAAERVTEEEDCEVETDLLQAREVGPAIIDEAMERGVDLIVIGITYKRRFGEFSLGECTPYVLKNAPCQVWVCRAPIA